MSIHQWIENEVLDRIAYQVFNDTHDSKNQPEYYILRIRTNDELLIICDAIINLSKYARDKREAGSRTKHPQKKLLKQIEDMGNLLYEYGLLDEYHDLMRIKSKIKQHKTWTAKQYALSIAKHVENELLETGTSKKRIGQINRFLTDAVIAVSKNVEEYQPDIDELSKVFL